METWNVHVDFLEELHITCPEIPKNQLECSWLVHFQVPHVHIFLLHMEHMMIFLLQMLISQLNKHINRWQCADAKKPSVGSTMFNCLTTTGSWWNHQCQISWFTYVSCTASAYWIICILSTCEKNPLYPGQCFLKLSKATNSKPLKPQTLEPQHP